MTPSIWDVIIWAGIIVCAWSVAVVLIGIRIGTRRPAHDDDDSRGIGA